MGYDAHCDKCGFEFKAKPNPDIYASYAKRINKKLATYKKGVVVFIDADRESVLAEIAWDFKRFKNWIVEGPFQEVKTRTNRIICKECGFCKVCLKCRKCGKIYQPNPEKICSECSSDKYFPIHIKNQTQCPYCNGTEIKKYSFLDERENITECPKCGTKHITRKELTASALIIKRFKGFI